MIMKFFLATSVLLLSLESVGATPLYHCGKFVRTRPCNMEFHPPKNGAVRPQRLSSRRAQFGRAPALFSSQSFELVAQRQGVWRGFVAGTGEVQLYLHILAEDKQEAPRKIGSLKLRGFSHPIRYTFKGPAPKTPRWSWRVVAAPLSNDNIG